MVNTIAKNTSRITGDKTMRYLLMIFDDETRDADATPEQMQAVMAEYDAFTAEVDRRGANKGSEALMPTTMATSVRVRDGKVLTSDGPFAETKEQLGGYYLIDCKDLNEAIEIAALCPGAKLGTVELRPIMELGEMSPNNLSQ
jgi:hypothetical protein